MVRSVRATPYFIGLMVKDYEMKAPDFEIVVCKICKAEMFEHKLHEHIDIVHSDETDKVREDAHGA